MAAMHTSAGAIYLMQILASAFLAILFLQSGIDKIVDRRGNLEWLKGHFAKSPLAGTVPALLTAITILEVAAGVLSALGMRACACHARFDGGVLRCRHFRSRDHRVIFRAANRQGLCWRRGACSLLSARTGRNLSARAGLNEVRIHANLSEDAARTGATTKDSWTKSIQISDNAINPMQAIFCCCR